MISRGKALLAVALFVTSCAGDKQRKVQGELPSQADKDLTRSLGAARFQNEKAQLNLSDVAVLSRQRLAVVSDEGTEFAVIDPASGRAHTVDLLALVQGAGIPGLSGQPKEIDLEAVAQAGDLLFVAGSASLKRTKPKEGKSGNAERIAELGPASGAGHAHSNYVYVLRDQGTPEAPRYTLERAFDLRTLLLGLPILAPFRELPSKDNGLDVEGAAAVGSALFFGLRGPVLRGHAVVARTDAQGTGVELFFLDLDGLGVRALSPASDGGLLVLAGVTMEHPGPFVLYRWDGKQSVFRGEKSAALKRIGVLEQGDVKPEAVFPWHGHMCWLGDGQQGGDVRCTVSRVD